MNPELIIVHDINKAIKDLGIWAYADRIVQEMGGDYYFVDVEIFDELFDLSTMQEKWHNVEKITQHRELESTYPDGTQKQEPYNIYMYYRITKIPLKIAWFIIDALRLKSQAMGLGETQGEPKRKQAVYLTPGKELFGHKVKTLTEIPAELRPVVVEKIQ